MTMLIGVAGFSGSGKTTAVEYLQRIGPGEIVYLGKDVLDDVRQRGLSLTAENQKTVRLAVRHQEGRAVFAQRELPTVKRHLDAGKNVFVDAIFVIEEYLVLRSQFREAEALLLAIEAPFAIRSRRLSIRPERPASPRDLELRDETEVNDLRTDEVIAAANYKLANDGTIEAFRADLRSFWLDVTGQEFS